MIKLITFLLMTMSFDLSATIPLVSPGDSIQAETMNQMINRVNTIQDGAQGIQGEPGPAGPQGPAGDASFIKAWVRFDGNNANGTNSTITSGFNVASVYKNGIGNFTITFINPMIDANYTVFGSARRVGWPQVGIVGPRDGGILTTTQIQINVNDDGGTAINSSFTSVMIVR